MEDEFSQIGRKQKSVKIATAQDTKTATSRKSASFRKMLVQEFAGVLYTKDIFLDIGEFSEYFTVTLSYGEKIRIKIPTYPA
jgi:hypothetical protein